MPETVASWDPKMTDGLNAMLDTLVKYSTPTAMLYGFERHSEDDPYLRVGQWRLSKRKPMNWPHNRSISEMEMDSVFKAHAAELGNVERRFTDQEGTLRCPATLEQTITTTTTSSTQALVNVPTRSVPPENDRTPQVISRYTWRVPEDSNGCPRFKSVSYEDDKCSLSLEHLDSKWRHCYKYNRVLQPSLPARVLELKRIISEREGTQDAKRMHELAEAYLLFERERGTDISYPPSTTLR